MPKVKITQAQREEINELYGSELSSDQIGQRYGVAGGYVRMLWTLHRKQTGTPISSPVRRNDGAICSSRWPPRELSDGERALIEDKVVAGGKSLFDLQESDCRWPTGVDEEGTRRFCGCPRTSRMYCEAHAPISIELAPPKQATPIMTIRVPAVRYPQ